MMVWTWTGCLLWQVRLAAFALLASLAGLPWGAASLCASEGVIELLTSSHAEPLSPGTDELRTKHAATAAVLKWGGAPAALGASTAAALEAYVAAGPFAAQPKRAAARPAAPLTL